MWDRTIWNGFRFALAIISGKIIFNFGIAERLRTLRYPILREGVVTENGSSSACFLRKRGAVERNCQSPHYEKDKEHTLLFAQKIRKNV